MTETAAKALLAELESILSGCDDFLTGYRLGRLIEDITGRLTQHHAAPTEESHMTQLEMFADMPQPQPQPKWYCAVEGVEVFEVELHTGNEPEEGVEVQVIVGEEPQPQPKLKPKLFHAVEGVESVEVVEVVEVAVEVHTGNEPEEGVEVQVIVGEEPLTQEEVRKELLRVAAALNEMADRVAKVIVDVTGAALKA